MFICHARLSEYIHDINRNPIVINARPSDSDLTSLHHYVALCQTSSRALICSSCSSLTSSYILQLTGREMTKGVTFIESVPTAVIQRLVYVSLRLTGVASVTSWYSNRIDRKCYVQGYQLDTVSILFLYLCRVSGKFHRNQLQSLSHVVQSPE